MFPEVYGSRARGLSHMLGSVGMAFEGRPHSGLDDSKNTARLLLRMLEDGAHLRATGSADGAGDADGSTRGGHRRRGASRRNRGSARRVPALQHG